MKSSLLTAAVSILAVILFFNRADCRVVDVGPCTFVLQPQDCNTTYLQFHLFTSSNRTVGQIVVFGPQSDNLTSSYYDPTLENKVIIHGFNADINLFALRDIKNGYLDRGEYNVWMMDWSRLSGGSCYPAALHNVQFAGQCLATAVERLRANTGNGSLSLHVIGFSLGAHVPQAAATLLKPYLIPRITGLDPAMPGFLVIESRERLSRSAAQFVDVFHTNGLMQGLMEPLGHADFYLNGGITQPGCFRGAFLDWLNCDHVRAPQYFAESINSESGFWAYECNDMLYLIGLCRKSGKVPVLSGEHVANSLRGSYVVQTNSEPPFAKGR